MGKEVPISPADLVRRLRRSMMAGLIGGAAIVIGAVVSLADGREMSSPLFVLVAMGAGLLGISVRYLMPGQMARIRQRYEAALRNPRDDLFAAGQRVARRGLLITTLALAVEIPL